MGILRDRTGKGSTVTYAALAWRREAGEDQWLDVGGGGGAVWGGLEWNTLGFHVTVQSLRLEKQGESPVNHRACRWCFILINADTRSHSHSPQISKNIWEKDAMEAVEVFV